MFCLFLLIVKSKCRRALQVALQAVPRGIVLVTLSAAAQASDPAAVGEVTLSIGRSSLERQASASEPQRGERVREGDVIRTTASGHVHIRFVDGGLVSVRPDSVFRIQEFKYNPANPAASTVVLNLEAGEVRSISGAAAKAARERFRLNTPLVAIGVKGTDFLTRTASNAVTVTVNEGAIVMAPYDQACRIDALGTCSGSRARELRADMGALALVYRTGALDPSFQPMMPQSGDVQGRANDGVKVREAERQYKENGEAAGRNVQVASETRAPLDVLSASRLVWGRWSNVAKPGDTLTTNFLDALRGNEVTVGDGYYFLFRQPGVANLLPSLNSKVEFGLVAATANYRLPNGQEQGAGVGTGTLGFDFANRTFVTKIGLSSDAAGTHTVAFAGSVNPLTGIFLASPSTSGGASLAGALALDATGAGYHFVAPVGTGTFTGATLWGRP